MQNKKLTIYLAHPGDDKTKFRAKVLQNELEEAGYRVFNPFDGNEYTICLTRLWDQYKKTRTHDLAYKIVKNDFKNIESADVLVAFVTKPSIGTSMEIYYADVALNKPVIILTKIESPWLMTHGTVVSNLEELLAKLKEVEEW